MKKLIIVLSAIFLSSPAWADGFDGPQPTYPTNDGYSQTAAQEPSGADFGPLWGELESVETLRKAPNRNPLKPDIRIPFDGHGLIYYTPSCYEVR